MGIRKIFPVLWMSLAVLGLAQTPLQQTVVFVCEHGSAKSMIAAAHFNRIAESKGLPYRAVSRGVHPDAEVPENIRSGLLADGIKGDPPKPKMVGDDDIKTAARVVTLGCELPKGTVESKGKTTDWGNLPPSVRATKKRARRLLSTSRN